jgi:hypothetical protein
MALAVLRALSSAENVDDAKFEALSNQAELVASHARVLAESAYQRNSFQLRLNRLDFKLAATEMMALLREVVPIDGAGGSK